MREIKFRGKRVDNGEWVYGDLAKYLDGSPFIMSKPYFATRDLCDEDELGLPILSDEMALGGFISVIPETVGQLTGLKDKNGVDIYEGDILKCLTATEPEDRGFICQFKDYRWKFYNVTYPDDDFYGTVNYKYIQQNCEIIANIHDNPELL